MEIKKKVSLKDIAKRVGVSTALVSYVLNNKFTDRINPETAKKIRDVIDEIKYQPNQIAKSLKAKKTFTIGLIVADISNLFYSSIARIIEDEARKYKYNVIYGSADEQLDRFEELVEIFSSRQVDGLILAAPVGAEQRLSFLTEQQVPFVLIDRYFPGHEAFPSVIIDNYQASCKVAEHLLAKGFKQPVMITLDSQLQHLQDRSNGFKDTVQRLTNMEEAKVFEVPEEALSEKLEQLILKLLQSPATVDAIYFSTNKIALEGLAVLAKYKIKVPEQVGIVCFDEAYAYNIFNTSITFVKQPLERIGREAVELVLAQSMPLQASKPIILETSLIGGNSTRKTVKEGRFKQ